MMNLRSHENDLSLYVSLSYKISCLVIVIGVIYTLFFLYINQLLLGSVGALTVFSLSIALILLKFKKTLTARWVIIVVTNLATLFFAIVLGKETGIHDFFYGLCILPFILFNTHDRWKQLLGLSVSGIEWLGSNVLHNTITPLFIMSDTFNFYIKILTGFMNFAILGLSLNFFLNAINRSHFEIQTNNKTLQKAYQDLKKSKSEASELARQLAIEELSRQSAYATLTRGIAHEIKNPLHMLAGRAELVLDDLDNKASVEKFAQVIIRNVKRLKKLIHAMLEYGASSGIDKETFSITTVIDDISELSQHKGKEEGISISSEWTEECTVFGNKIFIYQAILNLVVNAIQYTSRGGSITLSCVPRAYEDKDGVKRNFVEVAVSDTGVGISKENLKNIFTPYYTSKARPENTGLGLSMAFKTVAENDGRLDVESEVGVGTTFRVCLPIHG